MEWLLEPQNLISLFTLTLLEIVLGVDNIVFISILAAKLPQSQQANARRIGLLLALVMRVLLLCGLAWMVKLTAALFTIPQLPFMHEPHPISGRDLILIVGGFFLIWKATHEIHEKLEGEDGEVTRKIAPSFMAVMIQIMMLDIVFSLDSVITAVGMVKEIKVMILAVILAVVFMLAFADAISGFIEKHPTLKMLALSFLILIGFVLLLEGFHREVPKGYIYFAMAFSVGVEMINIRMRRSRSKSKSGSKSKNTVELHQPYR
jgi:predicted tellurium resistance membrane protein TerC